MGEEACLGLLKNGVAEVESSSANFWWTRTLKQKERESYSFHRDGNIHAMLISLDSLDLACHRYSTILSQE